MNPKPCHYCGNPRVEYVELRPDKEFMFGPGGWSQFHIACPDCGLRGASFSFTDVPRPRVTRSYNLRTRMGTFPIEDYEEQDTDAEIRALAVNAWNSMPSRYTG